MNDLVTGAMEEESMSESSVRVEIALRSAIIAKSCLEMMSLEPSLCRLQLEQVVRECADMSKWLQKSSVKA
jgi:hypothetical protein